MAVENSRLGGRRSVAFSRAAALQPFKATNCTLAWVLLGNGYQPVLSLDANYSINKSDPSNGAILINIARYYTAQTRAATPTHCRWWRV
jgi:hypothetical protein